MLIPHKVKQNWYIGKKKISLYELYAVWGHYIKVRPSAMTPELVQQYLEAKKNKTGPFQEREVVYREVIIF